MWQFVVASSIGVPQAAEAADWSGPLPIEQVSWAPSGLGKRDAAVVVAIEKYPFLGEEYAVPGADKAGRAWKRWLQQGRGVRDVTLLTGTEARRGRIEEEIRRLAGRVTAEGTAWVVFIGHGTTQGGDGVLLGAKASFEQQGFADAIGQSELRTWVAGDQGQTVLVLDACFTGFAPSGQRLPGLENTQAVMPTAITKAAGITTVAATARDEYAGSVPGLEVPAFSYFMLGAMAGWAEPSGAWVTLDDAVRYSTGALGELRRWIGPKMTPQLVGEAASLPLGRGEARGRPDLIAWRDQLSGATAGAAQAAAPAPASVPASSSAKADAYSGVRAEIARGRLREAERQLRDMVYTAEEAEPFVLLAEVALLQGGASMQHEIRRTLEDARSYPLSAGQQARIAEIEAKLRR